MVQTTPPGNGPNKIGLSPLTNQTGDAPTGAASLSPNNQAIIANAMAENPTKAAHRDLLTVDEAATELRLAPKSVRKLIKRKLLKVLPGVKPFLVTARSLAKLKEGCDYHE